MRFSNGTCQPGVWFDSDLDLFEAQALILVPARRPSVFGHTTRAKLEQAEGSVDCHHRACGNVRWLGLPNPAVSLCRHSRASEWIPTFTAASASTLELSRIGQTVDVTETASPPLRRAFRRLHPQYAMQHSAVHEQRVTVGRSVFTFGQLSTSTDEWVDGVGVLMLPNGRVFALDHFMSVVSVSDFDRDGVFEVVMDIGGFKYGGSLVVVLLSPDGFLPGMRVLASYGC